MGVLLRGYLKMWEIAPSLSPQTNWVGLGPDDKCERKLGSVARNNIGKHWTLLKH